ncbi:hypothetical protein [Streptomyces zagrosensis]|uniref:Thiamine transporter ThiT n=1 Tax=Streptomyces zagrosensis TaxID=1042984 RepID=A0A7W9Q5I0_9ACTN|nr:hypothetical protein [Streptomyces zagrosensis]MBB5933880.1 thiamine transporter ThiT [Streptomyces zagrosensis]
MSELSEMSLVRMMDGDRRRAHVRETAGVVLGVVPGVVLGVVPGVVPGLVPGVVLGVVPVARGNSYGLGL